MYSKCSKEEGFEGKIGRSDEQVVALARNQRNQRG